MVNNLGTAAAANLFLAFSMVPPTVSTMPDVYPAVKKLSLSGTHQRLADSITPSVSAEIVTAASSRDTGAQEKLIGALRSWLILDDDWDGEGAAKPVVQSIREAVSFARLLPKKDVEEPEPMLTASGHAALFWNTGDLYADIEFLGDQRIAYFVKRESDKHKGVVSFDSEHLPIVFQALLCA